MMRSCHVTAALCALLVSSACLPLFGGPSQSKAMSVDRQASLISLKKQDLGPVVGSQKIKIDKTRLEAVKKLAIGKKLTLERLPLADGSFVDAELTRVNVFTDDAYVRVMRGNGLAGGYQEEQIPIPDVVMLSGRLADDPNSIVFVSIDGDNVMGYIRTDSRTEIISSGAPGQRKDPVIYDLAAIPADAIVFAPEKSLCLSEGDGAAAVERRYPELTEGFGEDSATGGVAGSLVTCKQVRMAIDLDADMLNFAFGGSTMDALVYVVQLAGAQNQIFTRDVGVHLSISRVTVWDTDDEPWTRPDNDPDMSDISEQIREYRDWYEANVDLEDYDLAHLLVFDSLGGGVAWREQLCTGEPFAVSTHMRGYFPYPVEDYSTPGWDLKVFTHENGHVLGALHTHEYCPPIDSCAKDDAMGPCQAETICQLGTIMSYCHSCPGGLANIHLGFHPENVLRMREHVLSSGCLESMNSTFRAFDDTATTLKDCAVAIDVLANDLATCEQALIAAISPTSSAGGTLEVLFATEPYGQWEVLYTPPAGFTGTDSFTYTAAVALMTEQDTGRVEIEVTERAPSQREILVLDSTQDAVYRFDANDGQFIGVLIDSGAGSLDAPTGLALGPDGDIYITSLATDDVRRFDGDTGVFKGVFFSDGISNPVDIQIDDEYAYILGGDHEQVFPWEPQPQLKLLKVDLATGAIAGMYLNPLGIGKDLDLRNDGSLVMVQEVVGSSLLQFDTDTMLVTAGFALSNYGVDDPVCVNGANKIAVLDGSSRRVTLINAETFSFLNKTQWNESDIITFEPREIVYASYGTRYCVHDEGVSEYELTEMTDFIGLSPAHLQSPRAMVIREMWQQTSGDFNDDGSIDGLDLAILLGQFGGQGTADLTGDGVVDGADLATLLGEWSN